jgi:prophage antirepressor-like protein
MSKHFDLETFTFNGHTLRTVTLDGTLWFVGKDVLRAIGIAPGGTAYDSVPEAERRAYNKGVISTSVPPEHLPALFPGRSSSVLLLSESGLYSIAMRAQRRNPAAKEFQD